MKPILLASLAPLALAVTSSIAAAAPAAPAPAPPPRSATPVCKAGGTPLFTIEVQPIEKGDGKLASRETLLTSGSWVHTFTDASGARTEAGCLTADQAKAVDAALAKATWATTQDDVTCAAIGVTRTTYSVRGAAKFTESTCSGIHLDAAGQAAITNITRILNASSTLGGGPPSPPPAPDLAAHPGPPAPVTGDHKPPCCKP